MFLLKEGYSFFFGCFLLLIAELCVCYSWLVVFLFQTETESVGKMIYVSFQWFHFHLEIEVNG